MDVLAIKVSVEGYRLRLIIVVEAYKILHCVIWKELFEFLI
jgi:hypothetical protein